MLQIRWITAILQLYSQVADLFGNVIVKHINIRLFDLLARFHYILNLPRSLVDYVLASQNLFPFVKEFDDQDPNILSDHCVINFFFSVGY